MISTATISNGQPKVVKREFHPAANLYRMMSDDELARLKQGILDNGQRVSKSGLIALDGEELKALIATVPTTGEPSPQIPAEQALEKGLIAAWDPDYRERLGI